MKKNKINRKDDEPQQDTEQPPGNLSEAFFRIVWRWNPILRNLTLIIVAVFGITFSVWVGIGQSGQDTIISWLKSPTPTPEATSTLTASPTPTPTINQTHNSNKQDEFTMVAEFIVDEKGNPTKTKDKYEVDGKLLNGYWIRVSLANVPQNVTSVIYEPLTESLDKFRGTGANFQGEFSTYGRFFIEIRAREDGVDRRVETKSLIDALERKYKDSTNPEIIEALEQIRAN